MEAEADKNKTNEPKPRAKLPPVSRTDLGLIIVITKGDRDLVFLAHNHLKIFSIKCPPGEHSQIVISKQFYTYAEKQWDEVFHAYLKWKRSTCAHFKLPTHSGRRTDGAEHPWRWHRRGDEQEPKKFSKPKPSRKPNP